MSTKTILSIAERRKALEDRYPIWPRDTIARHFEKACSEYKDRPYMYIDGK
ncbi:hypothetical protein [Oceanobacillus caeni]|nr:hypothetical protein [Oceanobacillus caeni]MED4475333.1 hypothetical protein [Oceanobacillus caeni]